MRKYFMPATCELDPEPYWDEVQSSRWSFEKQIEDTFVFNFYHWIAVKMIPWHQVFCNHNVANIWPTSSAEGI